MDIQKIDASGYEEVWRAEDAASRFLAFIAVHNLKRGPALGGVRLWRYPDPKTALEDALRLARAMTWKSAVAGLPHGGGKGVIVEPHGPYDRTLLYRRFGEFVEHLQGRYITAKDAGTHLEDLGTIRESTRYATGLPPSLGGAGDPSPLTAYGVKIGIQVGVEQALGRSELKGLKVAIQGLGSVGSALAAQLAEAGCELWGSDLAAKNVMASALKLGLHPQLPELILGQEADVLAPCALGSILNETSISKLRVRIVAGAANDPLADERRDPLLLEKLGILYAPDFVINAGGLIHVAQEWAGYEEAQAIRKTEEIGPTLRKIFQMARQEKITTHAAALLLAESRLQ